MSHSWTMSDMVKYRAALWSFLKLTALVFYHVWHSPLTQDFLYKFKLSEWGVPKKTRWVLTKEIILFFESVVGTLIYGSCCYFEASNPPIHTWWKHFRNQKIMAHLKSLLYREISWEGYPMKYFFIIFCTLLIIE